MGHLKLSSTRASSPTGLSVCLSVCHSESVVGVCSLLRGDDVKLMWNVVCCLVMLSSDADSSTEIRSMGGIPLLLSMIRSVDFTETDCLLS